MKNIIAVFCVLFLAPTFNTYAWIGGPFSNNSYTGSSNDDGVYEATATATNTIGIFRIVVANNIDGSTEGTGLIVVPGFQATLFTGTPPTTSALNSGNIFIGGFGFQEGPASNVWFRAGLSYFGRTIGTVNSSTNTVFGIGSANVRTTPGGISAGTALLSSQFSAKLNANVGLLPAAVFTGTGTGTPAATGVPFPFTVMGSRVSTKITFGK